MDRRTLIASSIATLASTTAGTFGGFLDTTTLPTSGAYTILVDPQGSGTGGVTLTLYDVPVPGPGPATSRARNGAALAVAAMLCVQLGLAASVGLFDDVGPLAESWRIQPGTPGYTRRMNAEELTVALAAAGGRT